METGGLKKTCGLELGLAFCLFAILNCGNYCFGQTYIGHYKLEKKSEHYAWNLGDNDAHFVVRFSKFSPENDPRTPEEEKKWWIVVPYVSSGPSSQFHPDSETSVSVETFTSLLSSSMEKFTLTHPDASLVSLSFKPGITPDSWNDLLKIVKPELATLEGEIEGKAEMTASKLQENVSHKYKNAPIVTQLNNSLVSHSYRIKDSQLMLVVGTESIGKSWKALENVADLGLNRTSNVYLSLEPLKEPDKSM